MHDQIPTNYYMRNYLKVFILLLYA